MDEVYVVTLERLAPVRKGSQALNASRAKRRDMRKSLFLIATLLIAGCAGGDLTAQERFEDLRGSAGALGVSYDVTVNTGVSNDQAVQAYWHEDWFTTVVTPSDGGEGRVVKSTAENKTVLCRSDTGGDGRVVYDCDHAEDVLRGQGSYHDLIGVALMVNESSLNYTGESRVAGRACHGFLAELDASEEPLRGANRRIRSDFCLDDATGRPLVFDVQRAQLGVDGSVDWATVVSMEATTARSVGEDDAVPPVPFTVTRSYASYADDEFHAVIEALTSFNESLDAGNLSSDTVRVGMDAGETRHVVLPVSDASRAPVNNDFVEGSAANIPVCVEGACHEVGARDPCIIDSDSAEACREAQRCTYQDGVCMEQPESCAGLDDKICEGVETRSGASCQLTRYGCEAEQDA